MKLSFINRFQRDADPTGGLISAAASAVGGQAAGAIELGMGVVQAISGANKASRLVGQRRAFTTPDEYFQQLQATQSRAQQGYDAFTLNYLTSQTDRAFADSSSKLMEFGGDPNDVAALFQQRMQGLMRIGADNHALNTENFGKYLGALTTVGQNKEAEWASQQDILKDKIQAAVADKQAGLQNITGGINTMLGSKAAAQTQQLYKEQPQKQTLFGSLTSNPSFGATLNQYSSTVLPTDIYTS